MKKEIAAHGTSAIMDILGLVGIPTNLAKSLFDEYLAKRGERARDELFDEIGHAKRPLKDVHEQDEFMAIVYRYLEAARQGSARLNLRLMAKVIRGQYEQEALYADEFLRYADMISSLTREEVIFLAVLNRHFAEADGEDYTRVYGNVCQELTGDDKTRKLDVHTTAIAVQRTGLVLPYHNVIGSMNNFYCKPSQLLKHIIELASFEDALRETKEAD